MPTHPLQKTLSKLGDVAILKRLQDSTFSSTYGVLDRTSTVYTEKEFKFFHTVTDEKIRQIAVGWELAVENVIWVSPDLDISARKGYDTDIVIHDGKEFKVKYVRRMDFINATYKLVGLEPMTKGALNE